MKGWEEIRAWRRSVRADLLARRAAMLPEEKKHAAALLTDLLSERFPELRHGCIGFYWPFKGEFDLRPLVEDLLALGAEAALPAAPEQRQPLEFRAWRPGTKLARDKWNIPVPAERNLVRPTVLIVPLLGFDGAGYRLGYGGGHYDRTLAVLDPRPLTIGVGYAFGRLDTIYPQPHDVPLDAIVTELGSVRHRYCGRPLGGEDPAGEACRVGRAAPRARDLYDESEEEEGSYASPPCFMHELDPSYLGYAGTVETIGLLNDLLACMSGDDRGAEEGRFGALLRQHILRLGGRPVAPATALSAMAPDQKSRVPGLAVRKLREILPRIGDDRLICDLRRMLEVLKRRDEIGARDERGEGAK